MRLTLLLLIHVGAKGLNTSSNDLYGFLQRNFLTLKSHINRTQKAQKKNPIAETTTKPCSIIWDKLHSILC